VVVFLPVLGVMNRAIKFYHELLFVAVEVRYVRAELVLTTEFQVHISSVSE